MAGQFFALTKEARQDVLSRPEFDHDVRENRRAQEALRHAGVGRRSPVEIENEYVRGVTERRRLLELLAPQPVTTLNENALLAANSLTQVANAAYRVLAAFNDLAGRLPRVIPSASPQPTLTATPVVTPQARR